MDLTDMRCDHMSAVQIASTVSTQGREDRKMKVVDQMQASWNQMVDWLGRIEGLRRSA
jgi:hypothetical protein